MSLAMTLDEALKYFSRGYYIPCQKGAIQFIGSEAGRVNHITCKVSGCLDKGQVCCKSCAESEKCKYRCDKADGLECENECKG